MRELPEFSWSADLACEVDLIDRQHHNLLDLVNLLRGAVLRSDRASTGYILQSLKAYVNYHFSAEEQWAREHRIDQDELARHARTHKAFTDHILKLTEGEPLTTDDLCDLHHFLSAWLLRHIAQEDRDMVQRLRATA